MSRTTLALAQELYAAFGRADLPAVLELLDPNVEWELVGPTQIPYFGIFHGRDGVGRFFAQLFETEVTDEFVPEQFIDGGAAVVVLGRERGTIRATGNRFATRWAHVFESSAGQITRWREFIDTAPIVEALGKSVSSVRLTEVSE